MLAALVTSEANKQIRAKIDPAGSVDKRVSSTKFVQFLASDNMRTACHTGIDIVRQRRTHDLQKHLGGGSRKLLLSCPIEAGVRSSAFTRVLLVSAARGNPVTAVPVGPMHLDACTHAHQNTHWCPPATER